MTGPGPLLWSATQHMALYVVMLMSMCYWESFTLHRELSTGAIEEFEQTLILRPGDSEISKKLAQLKQ